MGIKKLSIRNYKSIKFLEDFELNKVNILIGPNGSGKSNFIGFFKLIKKIYEQNLQLYIAQMGGADKFLYNGVKHSTQIDAKITFDNKWQNKYEFILEVTSDNNFYFVSEYSSHKSNRGKINNGGEKESQLKKQKYFRDKYLIALIESLRIFHFHDTSFTSKMRFPSLLSDNIYLQEDGSNLASILYKIKEKNYNEYSTIISVIQSILPYFQDFYLIPENNQIALKWKAKNQEILFDSHQLSDGSLRFIALTTLLMQPNLPQVIIIDEPELGLHPYAINQLSQMLHIAASQGSQIIISTQSPDLIAAYISNSSQEKKKSIEDIIVTEFENNQTILKRLNYQQLEHWLEQYTIKEIWEKNLIGGQPK